MSAAVGIVHKKVKFEKHTIVGHGAGGWGWWKLSKNSAKTTNLTGKTKCKSARIEKKK